MLFGGKTAVFYLFALKMYISYLFANFCKKRDGKISLADAMSRVFAYISATMLWILQRMVSN